MHRRQLLTCKRGPRFDVFLVANDKHGLYPRIAERAGLRIVKEWKRPVLRRSERNRQPYTESIFHMKVKNET